MRAALPCRGRRRTFADALRRFPSDIAHHADAYDSFVVLHGTDTMAFTAAALSFMLENLSKTVVVTGAARHLPASCCAQPHSARAHWTPGSQIPLSELRNDAERNLLDALLLAGLYDIPEVCLFVTAVPCTCRLTACWLAPPPPLTRSPAAHCRHFNNELYRGNRCTKVDASMLGAFTSANYGPLATGGIDFNIHWHRVRPSPPQSSRLRLRTTFDSNVLIIRLFPGLQRTFHTQPARRGHYTSLLALTRPVPPAAALLRQLLQAPVRGVVLQTFGAGNSPDRDPEFLSAISEVRRRRRGGQGLCERGFMSLLRLRWAWLTTRLAAATRPATAGS